MATMSMFVSTHEAREREWAAMTIGQRGRALRNLAWGYECLFTVDELRGIVLGEYGPDLSARFIGSLQRGVANDSGFVRSFAATCVNYERYDILEMMATLPTPVVVDAHRCSPSEWLDRLCTRVTSDGSVVVHTLFEQAIQRGQRHDLLAFAYKHQPDHPHTTMLVEQGGPAGAVMAELLMAKSLQAGKGEVDERVQNADAGRSRRRRMGPL